MNGVGALVTGIGEVSPAWPAHVADDIGLLFVESTGGDVVTLSAPNGFTEIAYQDTGAGGTRLTVFWARAASGAMGAPTVADPGDHVAAAILTFRGAIKSGNPWDVTGGGVKTPASVTVSATGVTNAVEDTLLVLGVSSDIDSKSTFVSSWVNANLTGITEHFDESTNAGGGGGIAVMTGTHTVTGATGTTVVSVTSSLNAYINISLKRLTAPDINSLTPAARQISAGWPAVGGAASYTLVAALAQANPPDLTYTNTTAGTSATVSSLAANTTYYVYSRSNGTGENSEWKLFRATATLVEFPPASPVISAVTDSTAQLSWSNNGNPLLGNIYRVRISTAADPLNPAGAVVTSSDTYTLSVSSSGLSPNTTYYFKASGVNHNNIPTAYITASTCTPARIPLSPAFGTVGVNSIQYSWSANNNPAGTKYRVQVSTAANMDAPAGAVVTSSDTYNLSLSSSGLSVNTVYYFRAAAVNRAGAATAYTAAQSTSTWAILPVFSSFSGVETGVIQLNWTTSNPSGTLYRVQASTASDLDLPAGAAVTTADTYSLSLSSSGLGANTTYYFRVAAINNNGVSTGYFSTVSTATLAAAPAFSAFSGITNSAATFSWTASNPEGTLYRVKVSTAPDPLSPGSAAVTSSDTYNTSLSSSGLSVNTTYYFTATAVNRNAILTAYTAVQGAATQANAPAFSALAVPSSGEIVVSWTQNGNPPGTLYRIAVSTADDPLAPGFAAASSSDTYNLSLSSSGLNGNTTYYFRMAGVNRSGEVSAYTSAEGTSTLAAQPSSFDFAGVSTQSVQLTWSGSGNGPGTLYRVQVSTASDMDAPAGAVVTSTETYDLYVATSGLTYSTEYYFRAAAVNNNGIMNAYTAAGSTSTLAPGAISAPIADGYTPYSSSITATWSLVDSATGYTLAASLNPGAVPEPVFASSVTHGAELSAYLETLNPDTIYYMFVRANGDGVSSAWAYYPAVATLLANAPVFDTFPGVDTNSAAFSWTANGNAYPGTRYRVVSSTAPDPLAPGGAVVASSYTYSLSLSSSGLAANTTYYFRVAGINKDGAATAYTAVQATATTANAPAFTNFTGIGTGAVQFNWAGAGNPAGTLYRVWASTAPDPLAPGGAAATSSDTYNTYLSSSGLTVNTTYYFRVAGINRAGTYTAYTAAAGTSTLANAPAFQAFSGVTSAAAAFSWTAPGNPAGTLYRVLSSSSASPQPGGAGVISSDTYNTSLSSSGLTSDRAYYFSVAAVNRNGVATAYTGAQSTYTLTAAPAFSGFTGLAPSAIQFNWTSANPAGTLYRVRTSTAPNPLAPGGAAVTSSDTYNTYLSSSGLSVNTTYYFRVAGINGGGSPTEYTAASGTSTLTNTPAFNNFTEVWSSSVQFNWTAAGNPAGTVYRVETMLNEAGPAVTSSDTYNTYLSTTGLGANTTHYFRVAALNRNGAASAFDSTRATSTLANIPLFDSFSNVAGSKIQFSWTANGNAAGTLYRVLASTASNPLNPLGAEVKSNDTTDNFLYLTGLISQTTYYFRTAAVNHNDISTAYTSAQSTVTLPSQASTLYFRTAASALGGDALLMARAKGSGASTYTRNTLAGPVTPPVIDLQFTAYQGSPALYWYSYPLDEVTIAAPVTFNIWALQNNFKANSTVTAELYRTNGAGSILSTIASVVLARPEITTVATAQSWAKAPVLTALNSGDRLAVAWFIDDAGGQTMASGYTVSATLDGASAGVSGDSWVQVDETLAPARPSGFSSPVVSTYSVSAGWGLVEGATGYTLAASPYSIVPPVTLSASSVTIAASALLETGLVPNATYYLFARSNGPGASSAWVQFTATATLANPPQFSGFSNVEKNSMQFNWTANNNAAGTLYRVISSTASNWLAPGGAAVVSSYTYSLSLTSSGLTANTTYYFWASAINHSGIITAYTSGNSTATLANAPLFSSFSGVGASAVQSNWAANGNPAGTLYRVISSTASNWQSPGGAAVVSSDTYNLSLSSSGLALNTTYYFWAAAINRNGVISAYTSGDSTSTLATTPVFSGFTVPSPNQVNMAWTSGGNPAGTLYRVITSTASNWLAPGGAAVVSSDTYNLGLSSSGLAANTTYYFWAAALNKNGIITGYTTGNSTATLANPPLPAGFSAVGGSAVQFGWTANNNAAGTLYRVISSTASDWLSPGGAAVVSSYTYNTSISSSGLVLNTTYYFWAAAINRNGVFSAYTSGDSTSTLATAPVFSGFTVPSSGQAGMSWTSGGNPAGTLYRVITSTASNWLVPGGAAVVSSDTYNLSLSSAGLSANTTYYFWAAALNRNGVLSAYTSGDSTSTLADGPAFGTFTSVESGVIGLDWTSLNPAGTLYRVAASTSSTPLVPGFAAASSSDTYGTALSSAGLISNTTYFFRVAAVNHNGIITGYSAAAGTSTLAVPPSSLGSVGVSSYTVQFTWADPFNGPGTLYRVQISTAPDLDAPAGAAVTGEDTYALYVTTSGLDYSTEYYFRAAAVNNNGVMTSYAGPVSTTTLAPGALSAPIADGYTPYASSITATWSLVSGATGYTLAASINSGAEPSPVFTSSTTHDEELDAYVEGLVPDTVYYLFVRANGPGRSSAWGYFPAVATLLANAPVFDAFSGVGAGAAVFSWTANGNAYPGTQYRVVSSTAPDPLDAGTAVVFSSYTYNLSLSSSGLSANTTYYFRVAGVNKDGAATDYTAVQSTATSANAPAFTGFSGVGAGAIQFNWTGTGNPADTLYRVWTSTASNPLSPAGAVVTSSDTYNSYLSSSGLSANTTYFFSVAGINRAGVFTAYTAAAGTSTLAAVPVFQAFESAGESAITLSWTANNNPGGTLYRVLSSTLPGPQPGGLAVISSDTYNLSLSSSGLAYNTTCYFSVAGVNRNGVAGDYFAVQSTPTLAAEPVFAGFTGMGDSAVQLNWTAANPGGTLYRVWASTAPDPLNPDGAAATSSDTYNTYLSSSGLRASTTYYFSAAAVSHSGIYTAYTLTAGTSTLAAAPAFEAFADVSSFTARFSWTAPGNPAGTLYRVLVSTAADPANPGAAAVTSSDTYNLTLSSAGLSPDSPYYFRAAAVNHNGVPTDYSAPESTYTLTAAPAFLNFSEVFSSSARFNWSAGGNPAGTLYRVLTSTAPDPLAPFGAAVSSSDTYNTFLSSAGLSLNTLYYFRLAGVNGGGSPTAYTAAQATRTLTDLPVFTGFTEVWSSSVQFNWSAGGNPAGTLYRVLVSTAPDPLSPDGEVVTGSDTYNAYLSTAGLGYNTTYYFRAAGLNSDGTPSAYTSANATSTLANIPVFDSFSNVGSAKIQFNWTANGNPAGTLYRVIVSTVSDPLNPGGADVTSDETSDNFLFLTGLVSQTTYYFRASAVNSNGLETAYSAAQSTVTLTSVATTLYFRNTVSSVDADSRVMAASRGSSATTYTKSTLPGPVTPPTQATKFTTYGGGPAVTWYSYPLDDVTIAGGVTFNIWAMESNTAANATITAELYRTNAAGAVISTIAVAALDRTELTTVMVKQTWLQPPVPTALNSGDRLAVAYYIDDGAAVTMVSGRTVSASLDGPTAGVSGDSWVQVDETLAPARPSGFSVSAVSTFSVAAGWALVEGATGYTLAASQNNTVPPVGIAASSETAAGSALLKSGLSPNTTYYLFARSNGPGASSAWAAYTSTVTRANAPVFDAFSEVSATSVKFSWTANNNPAGTRYRVAVSTAPDPLSPAGAAVTTHNTYSLNITTSGLSVGAFYYFRAAAVSHNGVITDYTVAKGTPTLAVYLNEVYPSGASAPADWAELYNNTGDIVPLSGWKLNYVENTIALGGTPVTVWTGQAGDVVLPYSTFSITGLSMDLNGALTYHVKLLDAYGGLMDQVQWPSLGSGQSFARITDGNPNYFEIDPTPTKGYLNALSTDTYRINEVSYGALGGEFVEIYNTSAVSTRTLSGYRLRNRASSANGLAFRFTRKIYPLSYTVIDHSSLSDDGYTFAQVFGAQGLSAAGDFLALENSTGAVVDAVSWQSAGNNPRYDNRGAALPLADYAPANAGYSIIRQPTEGADTGLDAVDFVSSPFETLGSRSEGAGMATDNTLTYPQNNSQRQYLSRRFALALSFGQASGGGQANTVVFQRTGGSADTRSPHIYRLADLGFSLDSLTAQATAQYGPDFFDQDGYALVSSASYRMFFNSDTGSASADQIIIDTVTYDGSVHSVTASTASPRWMNNAARAAMIRLDVSNNSPAGFNTIVLTTVTFSLLDEDLLPLAQQDVRNLFNAMMLARDSDSGLKGIYEPGIDLSTVAYVPMASIFVDGNGLSTFTIAPQYLADAYVAAGSTRAFYIVLESTRNASAWSPNVFRVRFNAASARALEPGGGLEQSLYASPQVQTSSVTLFAPAQPPAGTNWPYVSPSSAPVNTLAGIEGAGLFSLRTYVGSTDGHLRAIDGNGILIWTFSDSSLDPINSSPTDSLNEGGAAYIYFANDGGYVYKVRDNGGTATKIWQRFLGVQIHSNIMVSGDNLYFGAADGKMHCIDRTTVDGADCGSWTDLAVGGAISATPLVDNREGVGAAWIGTENGTLVQVNTTSGDSVVSLNTNKAIRSSAFGDVAWGDSINKLFITSTDGNLYVAPLDLGESELAFSAGADIYTSPFVASFYGTRYAFFGDDAGRLHKVSTQTWTEPAGWPFQAGGAIRAGPVVVSSGSVAGVYENYAYFGGDDGYIYAINVDNGQLRAGWPVATGGPVRADPVIDTAEKTLTVGSNDGRTYVLYIGP